MLSIVEKVLLLKRVHLFRELPGDDLAKVAEAAHQVVFRPGEVILGHDDVNHEMYCVVSGTAIVRFQDQEIARLSSGETIGEMGMFSSERGNSTVLAMTEVLTIELSRDVFYSLLEDRPEIARSVIASLSRRIREMNRRLWDFERTNPGQSSSGGHGEARAL